MVPDHVNLTLRSSAVKVQQANRTKRTNRMLVYLHDILMFIVGVAQMYMHSSHMCMSSVAQLLLCCDHHTLRYQGELESLLT